MNRACVHFLEKTDIIVASLVACVLIYAYSAGVSYCIAGAVACWYSTDVAKKLIKQPRPMGTTKKISYGMPSSHAASITYYACYICAACAYFPLHPRFDAIANLIPLRTLVPTIIVPWALLILASRVWLGHHTWQQVAVGCGLGAGIAWMWLTLWTTGGLSVLGNEAEDWFVINMARI